MSRLSSGLGLRRTCLAAVASGAMLFSPAMLWAHAHLVKSLPAAKSRLSSSPTVLRLWFSEAPEVALTRITLLTLRGDTVPLGAVSRDSAGASAVATAILRVLDAGTYRVLWRTAAADGHPTHGEFTFTVVSSTTQPAAGVPPSRPAVSRTNPSVTAAPGDSTAEMHTHASPLDSLSPIYVAIRWLWLTALVLVVGTVAFRLFVLSGPGISMMDASVAKILHDRTARMGLWVTVVLGAAILVRLVAQAAVLGGVPVATILYHTTWGRGWLAQCGASILAALGFVLARRSMRMQRAGWGAAVVGATILAVTPALSGHAIATSRFTALAVLVDGAHVLGAGGWLGNLFALTAIGLPAIHLFDPAARGPALSVMVNRFSKTAIVFATLTLVSGGTTAWLHLGSFPALWQTRYGQTLLVKLGVLAGVIALGAYHWRVVRPALGEGGDANVLRLRRSVRVELLVGAVVLAVTAVLVATPIPSE